MNTMPQMPGHLAPVAMQQRMPAQHGQPVAQTPLPGNTGIVPPHMLPPTQVGMVPGVPGSMGLNPGGPVMTPGGGGTGAPVHGGGASALPSPLRPVLGDFRNTAGGGFDTTGFHNALSAYMAAQHPGAGAGGPATGGTTPATGGTAASPTSALTNFADSAGMQFAQQQGANVLNNLYAAHGQVQSGAAAKALQTFGQNTALQQYFPMYTNLLQGQQAMGLGAAQGIAGVGSAYGNAVSGAGQNYANSVGNLNSSLGNAIGQGALNIGNANANNAAIRGGANAGMWGTIGSSLGNIASSFAAPRY